jgi:hypothetical protein
VGSPRPRGRRWFLGRRTTAAVGIATLALLGFPGRLGSPAHAAPGNTCTWTGLGITSNWSLATNWTCTTPAGIAPGAGDTLNFPTAAVSTSNNDIAASSIFVAINFTGNHTITGNALGVSGSITAAGAGNITAPLALSGTAGSMSPAGSLTLGVVSGVGIALSAGNLTLAGADSAGATTVSGGALTVTGSTTQAVTVGAGTLGGSGSVAAIIMNGGTLLSGLTVPGSLSIAPAAFYSAGAGTTTTVAGSATVTGATLQVPSAGASPVGSPFTILTGHPVTGTFNNSGGIVDSPTRRFSISYPPNTTVMLTDIGAIGASATSTTLLTANPSSNPPAITATVTAVPPPACGIPSPTCPAPFGTVSFTIDGLPGATLPNPVPLVASLTTAGTATALYSPSLTAGGHNIVATYNPGNVAVFAASTSLTLRELVLAAAPPPPPPNEPAGAFIRTIATATVDNLFPTTLLGSDSARAVTFTIPAGALPNGTSVAIWAGQRPVLEPLIPPPPKQGYQFAAGVSWQAPDTTSPVINPAGSLTMTGAGIGPTSNFYVTTTTGMVAQNVAFGLNTVTVPITTDPGFVITTKPPVPQGYWLVAADGGIFPFGTAPGYGSTGNLQLAAPIVGMVRVPAGTGYWLVASDGGVFPFGAAHGFGSEGGEHLNAPIVGMASTPAGFGYWLVAADGGIFPFGSAKGYGSLGGHHLNKPIVGMEPTKTGHGYWLVASDGGIFPFGDAVGYGSTGGIHLNQPVVGMTKTSTDGGYWLVARDGGIFPFGDAVGYGSTGGMFLNQPIVGMTATVTGKGYWLVAADGGIFPFGAAQGIGSLGNIHLRKPIVGIEVMT